MSEKLKHLIRKFNEKDIPTGYKRYRGVIYPSAWKLVKLKDVLEKVNNRVEVKEEQIYYQIGIRSHGKGIFFKDAVTGREIGSKSIFWVEPDCFIVNIVFAWEQAVASTSGIDKGFVASHRFPMFKSKDSVISTAYLTLFFRTEMGVNLLKLASPGGAGRNKTLNQEEFLNLRIPLPEINIQREIVDILKLLEQRIELKKKMLNLKHEKKRWLIHSLYSGKKRVCSYNEKWRLTKLKDILVEHKEKNSGEYEVFSVTVNNGLVNQIEHLGKSYAAEDTSKYNKVKPDDIVYTKSPTGKYPFGIIKQSMLESEVIVSPLYGVFSPANKDLGRFIHHYFSLAENADRYLKPLATKGAKNTINISNTKFLSGKLLIPSNKDELKTLVRLMDKLSLEEKIRTNEINELENQYETYKRILINGICRID
ncbi:restriction endonuclease subunit S [Eubacteriaceae bacterium ES3]|nr:restriction endonuclease subunit S [Eubacteriaceae bacterium ES3]